jgi:hypothetical protein
LRIDRTPTANDSNTPSHSSRAPPGVRSVRVQGLPSARTPAAKAAYLRTLQRQYKIAMWSSCITPANPPDACAQVKRCAHASPTPRPAAVLIKAGFTWQIEFALMLGRRIRQRPGAARAPCACQKISRLLNIRVTVVCPRRHVLQFSRFVREDEICEIKELPAAKPEPD